jgi:5-deoxy-glucuronate isomerase
VLTPLVRPGEASSRYISLDLAELGPGERLDLTGEGERLAVIMAGSAELAMEEARESALARGASTWGTVGGRDSVFDGPGDAVYLPPQTTAHLTASGGPVTLAVASAPAGDRPAGDARVIPAGSQRVGEVGRDAWRRSVRTILGPEDGASRLLAGETVNPPGLWSSFPPHRHDRDAADEVRLEEVYLYRVRPAGGFGVQVRYDSDGEREARVVRDGEVAVITSGFHPVVAAPGYELYYLWVMAGEGRVLRPHLDPRHRWVEEGR